jgi:hypothetical protein
MKKSTFFLLVIMLAANSIIAQISEQMQAMSTGFNNALVLELPGANVDQVEKLWRDYLKDYGAKPKRVKGNREEWLADDADIPGIGMGNTVDVYAVFEENSEGLSQYVWIDLGGAYLSSDRYGDRYIEGEKFLMRFALQVTKNQIEIELQSEEDVLKNLERELERLRRDKEDLEREIEDARAAIARAEDAIRQNGQEQKARAKEIEAQRQLIELVRQKLERL